MTVGLIRTTDETIYPAALVTGGARRIGREIVLELARMGFDIALHYKGSTEEAEETAAEVTDLGRRAVLFDADLSDPTQGSALVDGAIDALGGLGVAVNNASIFEEDNWQNATAESWAAHMAINLEAPLRISQSFAGHQKPGQNGIIVNLIDQRVFNLTPHFLSYTVSKSGLWTLTRTLAMALAPDIRVMGIGPGPTEPSSRQSAESFQRQVDIVPLRRRTRASDVAKTVRFIIESSNLTGQMIALDGGEHLGWRQDADGAYIPE
ncbi:MAG: SDR family oxidoreductase [Alphaproteobacteria bacterium]